MTDHNRIEIGLPFKENDHVAEHNDKPKQVYIDKLLESIEAGETKVIK